MDDLELNVESAVDSISADLGFAGDEAPPSGESEPSAGPSPSPKSEPAAAASEPTKPAATSAPANPPSPVPKSWRTEAGAHWESLPEPVRQEVLKREEDILRGIEEYKGKAQLSERFQRALTPFQQFLMETNTAPEQAVQAMMAAHMFMAKGSPEQKIQAFQKLAGEYGVDLAQAGFQQQAIDPEMNSLRQQVQQLTGQLNQLTQGQHQALLERNLKAIEAFEKSPDHPFFGEVAQEITLLLERGVAKDLQDAYDKAVWQNPVIRAKVIEKQQAEAAAKAAAADKERAEAARKASAANVKTIERGGRPTAALGSIDDTLSETYREISSRAA
jgi:hypothetical protein